MLVLLLAAALSKPPEIRAYVARRDQCEHLAGEEAYDAARGRELARLAARSRCGALEGDRRRLLRRHLDAASRAILRPLTF